MPKFSSLGISTRSCSPAKEGSKPWSYMIRNIPDNLSTTLQTLIFGINLLFDKDYGNQQEGKLSDLQKVLKFSSLLTCVHFEQNQSNGFQFNIFICRLTATRVEFSFNCANQCWSLSLESTRDGAALFFKEETQLFKHGGLMIHSVSSVVSIQTILINRITAEEDEMWAKEKTSGSKSKWTVSETPKIIVRSVSRAQIKSWYPWGPKLCQVFC